MELKGHLLKSQCTFWCSVLSDSRSMLPKTAVLRSQCTFWCSVRSDKALRRDRARSRGLNAPFGAQCFPTGKMVLFSASRLPVSMHLLVLSAFRPERCAAMCSGTIYGLNAPFGAQCFPTQQTLDEERPMIDVSMHLLVLSAFRLLLANYYSSWTLCLNAPFGAQCFPTYKENPPHPRQDESQCTFWCSVLSDEILDIRVTIDCQSQCTFWCSVLSDGMLSAFKLTIS